MKILICTILAIITRFIFEVVLEMEDGVGTILYFVSFIAYYLIFEEEGRK